MTDTQMITIALIASLGAVVYNNSRITDLRDVMNNRFNDVNRHIDDKFALLSEQLKTMEGNILRLIGDHETRIQRLEPKK